MQIGSVRLANQLVLAPMAGVTDAPARILAKRAGAGLVVTEMISCKALLFNNQRTFQMLRLSEEEKPVAVQIFGSEPEVMAEGAKIAVEHGADIIDINMGCPTPKIVRNGEGSALLLKPRLAQKIIEAVVGAVKVPVTVKIRIGWDRKNINAVEMAVLAEEAGAQAITVHGRTREQFYEGKADWDVIRGVKEAVNIPVIGNGDIDSPVKAKIRIEESGVDGIMIGRAALGNPWIFHRIAHYLQTGELLPEPEPQEKIDVALEHLRMAVDYEGERIAVPEMRKHIGWYLKGLRGAAAIRVAVNQAKTADEVYGILGDYQQRIKTS